MQQALKTLEEAEDLVDRMRSEQREVPLKSPEVLQEVGLFLEDLKRKGDLVYDEARVVAYDLPGHRNQDTFYDTMLNFDMLNMDIDAVGDYVSRTGEKATTHELSMYALRVCDAAVPRRSEFVTQNAFRLQLSALALIKYMIGVASDRTSQSNRCKG